MRRKKTIILNSILLYFLISFLFDNSLFSEVNDSTFIIVNKYKNYEFTEYGKDKENYTILFNCIKNDFVREKGLNVLNEKDRVVFNHYIDLRDQWLTRKSEQNYIFALLLTRVLFAVLIDHVFRVELFESQKDYTKFMENYMEKIILTKYQLFSILDRIERKRNRKWESLEKLEKGVREDGKTEGWYQYIKNAEIWYSVDTLFNMQALWFKEKSIPLFSVIDAKSMVTHTDIRFLICESSVVVDMGTVLIKEYNHYINNKCIYNYNEFRMDIGLELCKKAQLLLYSNMINCDKPEKDYPRFEGRKFIPFIF